jgi:hypothetical protein
MTLKNLERIKDLHIQPSDKREFDGLLKAAVERLTEVENLGLSYAIRFDLAYNAAYGLALAALRAAGFRSGKRYLVFQCLAHTVDLNKHAVQLFSVCHDRRNRAEYEGHLESDESLLEELIVNTRQLLQAVEKLQIETDL